MASTDTTPPPSEVPPSTEKSSSEKAALEKERRAQFKKQSFDKEFRSFMKQAQETVSTRYAAAIQLGETRAELVCLNRYLAIYNNMDPQEHFRYFETIYNRKRSDVLRCLDDDRWLRTGNLVIQFGEGIRSTKEMEEKRKQVRIMLSDIYLIACDLQAQAEKGLDGIDEKFRQEAGGKDLIRPNILLLHLIRIFYHLNDGDDKVQLGKVLTQMEDDLGVAKKTVESDEIAKSAVPTLPVQTGGLSGLFSMATNMMERMGYKPPPGMKPPTETEISNVISTVFNNETTQTAIQGMFSSLQGCTDFSSAIQEVVKNVTDPKTMDAIQGSVMQTAQLTAAPGQSEQPASLPPQPSPPAPSAQ